MVLAALSQMTVDLILSLAISGVLWLLLFVLFGSRFRPWIAVLLLTLAVFLFGFFFDLTGGVLLVFQLALISGFELGSFATLAGFAPIIAAVGLIAVAVAVVAVLITRAVEQVE